MIKKIFCVFFSVMMCNFANANIYIYGEIARDVILTHIDKEYQIAALKEYNAQLKQSSNYTMSGLGLYKVCAKAGWDITTDEGKKKCDNFVNALLEQGKYKYYTVCGKDKGTSGGTEYCVTDIFSDIEVQLFQAKKLAQEYARVKYKDDIICSSDTRNGAISRIDDYLKCTSRLKPVYYEFKFDDLKEGDMAKAKYREMQYHKAICAIHGGFFDSQSADSSGKIMFGIKNPDTSDYVCVIRNDDNCRRFKSALSSKMGVEVTPISKHECKISNSTVSANVKYYAVFDGDVFTIYDSDNKAIKKWSARSGRGKKPDDENKTDCQLAQYQYCPDIGPTPSGKYLVRQQDVQYAKDRSIADASVVRWVKGGTHWDGKKRSESEVSYGMFRVPLIPLPGTDTKGRDSMYVHGGRFAGSAGCIDLVQHNNDFFEWFQSQDSDLEINVKYKIDTNKYCSLCDGDFCEPCKCKEEINKSTHETNCEYI